MVARPRKIMGEAGEDDSKLAMSDDEREKVNPDIGILVQAD
jgi:hypothetical protein